MATARVEAADKLAWNHTLAILAQIYNVNRDAKRGQRAMDPLQFCPYHRSKHRPPAPPPTAEDREMLRQLYPGKKR